MKRKMLSRLMAASLAAVMTVGLAGCGDNTENPDATQTPGNQGGGSDNQGGGSDNQGGGSDNQGGNDDQGGVEMEDGYVVLKDKNGNVPDLGGMEIIIADWFSGDGERPEAPDEATELLYDYQDWAMEKYNFKIVQKSVYGWGDCLTNFMDYVVAGGDEINYIYTLRNSSEFENYKKLGYMYDLSKLDCLNFNEDKWSNGVHLIHTDVKTGAIYAMRPIYAEPRTGMYFNKGVLQQAGVNPDDIYKWQEDGSWTWDKFEEVCEQIAQDKDGDGVPDLWPITAQDTVFYGGMVASNGADYVGMENGKYVNKLESNETMKAMNKALELWNKYHYPQPDGSEWYYFQDAWKTNTVGFFCGQAYQAGQDFNPDNFPYDFGFVCFPKGPDATDYCNIAEDNPYVIPSCYDDQRAWNIAFALNVWTQPIEGYEDYKGYLNNQYNSFRDTESVELTLARMCKNARTTYHSLIAGIEVGQDVYWKLNENNSLAQQVESIRNKWNYYIGVANGDLTEADMPDELKPQEDEG